MDVIIDKDGKAVVRMGDTLTIAQAADMKQAILSAFDQAGHVELDMGEVESIDLACMQIICAAHRTALNRKGQLTVSESSLDRLARPGQLAGFCRESGCVDNCVWSQVRAAA